MLNLLTNKNNRDFQRLWWAQLISQFGDRINQLALVGLIAERAPGSAMGLAKLLAFTILPVFVVQPFAGVFVDRWDRRTTLFVCDLIRCLLAFSIPLMIVHTGMMLPVYIAVFLSFCFSRFYIPAKMSIIPDIVGKDNLFMANSLVSTTGMIAFVIGCALGGFLVDKLGSHTGFYIDAGTFLLSGAIVYSMTVRTRIRESIDPDKIIESGKEWIGPIRRSVWQELKAGFNYIIKVKEMRFIMGMLFLLLAAGGAVYVVIIVFIQEYFHSVTRDLGVLAVCLGAGLFLGAILYGKFGKHVPWYLTIFICLTSGGLMLILFAGMVVHYANIHIAMALAFLWGVVIGPVFIAANTMVQMVCDEEMRGKMFSALEIVIHLAFLLAMLASSWVSEFVPRFWILVFVGVVVSGVGVYGIVRALYTPIDTDLQGRPVPETAA
jgi:MFS family permease